MTTGVKMFSLSLTRGTQTPRKEEDSKKPTVTDDENMNISCLDTALNSPVAHPSRLSSTPIQKNVERFEESPDLDYRGSPTSLYPCTQESGNEISWDWKGEGGRRSDDSGGGLATRNNGALNRTPKRPHLLKKKRLAKSNSPLLNIPPKRKLVDLEAAESIEKFAAELEALADEIKTGKNCRVGETPNAHVPSTSSDKPSNIFEMPTQKICDIHEASTMAFGGKSGTDKMDSSLDNLFDDLDEACMVQCSQEIEDKIKSEARRTPDLETNLNFCPSGERSFIVGYRRRNDDKIEKGDAKKDQIIASQIPDDSFDDCLALCSEDDEMLGNFLEDDDKKRDEIFDKLKKEADKTNWRQVSGANNQAFDSNSNLKRKQQFMSSEDASTAQNRKFFKEKSLSDTIFDKPGIGKSGKSSFVTNVSTKYPAPISKSISNHNLSSKTKLNDSVKAAGGSNNPAFNYNGRQQLQINKNANWSYRRNSEGPNTTSVSGDKIYRTGASEKPRDNPYKLTNSQLRCTPAEIERKRLAAKLKLEASRKKKLNSSRTNLQSFGIPQRPGVKR